MRILITGGAGFIGSVATNYFIERNFEVNVIDNLSTGTRKFIPEKANFFVGDIRNKTQLIQSAKGCDAILHLAGLALVGESWDKENEYLSVNLDGTRNLIEVASELRIRKIIFSSTCAVYGESSNDNLKENDLCMPINPYGLSKLKAEQALLHWGENPGNTAILFRFFNVSGAFESKEFGFIGEYRSNETHLIPNLSRNHSKTFQIYGNDFPTPDGTTIRDYLHITDLCDAFHLGLMVQALKNNSIFNLGSGTGFSVLEIIESFEKVNGVKVNLEYKARRKGDPAKLVANIQNVKDFLLWKPKLNIENILRSNFLFSKNFF